MVLCDKALQGEASPLRLSEACRSSPTGFPFGKIRVVVSCHCAEEDIMTDAHKASAKSPLLPGFLQTGFLPPLCCATLNKLPVVSVQEAGQDGCQGSSRKALPL